MAMDLGNSVYKISRGHSDRTAPQQGLVEAIRQSTHRCRPCCALGSGRRLAERKPAGKQQRKGGATRRLLSVTIGDPSKDGLGLMEEFKNSTVVSGKTHTSEPDLPNREEQVGDDLMCLFMHRAYIISVCKIV